MTTESIDDCDVNDHHQPAQAPVPRAASTAVKSKLRATSIAPYADMTSIRGISSFPGPSRRALKASALLDSRTFTGCVDRVFAIYRENGVFYPATVVDVGQAGDKNDFRVAYDEGEGQLCHVKNMRRLTLKVGDVVWHDETRYVVLQQALREEGLEADTILLLKAADAAPNTKPKRIKVRDIVRPHLMSGCRLAWVVDDSRYHS